MVRKLLHYLFLSKQKTDTVTHKIVEHLAAEETPISLWELVETRNKPKRTTLHQDTNTPPSFAPFLVDV